MSLISDNHACVLPSVNTSQTEKGIKNVEEFHPLHRQVKSRQRNISSNLTCDCFTCDFCDKEIDSLKLHMSAYTVNLLIIAILCILH